MSRRAAPPKPPLVPEWAERYRYQPEPRTMETTKMADPDDPVLAVPVDLQAKGAPPRAAVIEPICQFFAFDHLPPHLAAVSRPFCELAQRIVDILPRNPERTVALRKLLEAKDAAVRALVFR